jgi:hypothetical protein
MEYGYLHVDTLASELDMLDSEQSEQCSTR